MGEINKFDDKDTGIAGLNQTGGELDDAECDFWCKVFENVCANSASFEAAEEWADRAVLSYRRRRGL